MDLKEKFKIMMEKSPQIAIATLKANEEAPDIRLMCFYYDFKTKKIYFCTFDGSPKVEQFEKNSKVAFTTYAVEGDLAARVSEATVQRSKVDKAIILEELSKKLELFNQIKSGDISNIIPYEISFETAHLHIGHNEVVIYNNL